MSRLLSPLLALLILAVMLAVGHHVHTQGHADTVRLIVYPAIGVGTLLSLVAYCRLAYRSSADGKLPLLLLLSIYAEGAWTGLLLVLTTIVTRRTLGYEQYTPDALLYALISGVAVTMLIRGLILIVGTATPRTSRVLDWWVTPMLFRKRRR